MGSLDRQGQAAGSHPENETVVGSAGGHSTPESRGVLSAHCLLAPPSAGSTVKPDTAQSQVCNCQVRQSQVTAGRWIGVMATHVF